ncbi:antibiotic biosynthesis monooxygenase [Leptolyngbya sp. FACHB-261]|uniref:antibiotic biosynthesis monooxygenase n=1 Tax=Leptolyngbya sp. FACHB-261 TaxID=2692806 RepID=UPI001684FAAD|nr:antibiotic biosynthesis monooxygenase [Leptolyngbya sp. FACHB-261]MBD2102332.1 antibiotic biosynthesis monooxygenase [Leptolyngbya sp. FACHB-261]
MATITANDSVVTLISVHSCAPENQVALVSLLTSAAQDIYRNIPGFISASIHKSVDGLAVTNYAQWESLEHFEAAGTNPLVSPFVAQVKPLLTGFEAHLYGISAVVHA